MSFWDSTQYGFTVLGYAFTSSACQIVRKAFSADFIAILMHVVIERKESAHRRRDRTTSLMGSELREPVHMVADLMSEGVTRAMLQYAPIIYENDCPGLTVEGAGLSLGYSPLPHKLSVLRPSRNV
jgi:hypothetical protein